MIEMMGKLLKGIEANFEGSTWLISHEEALSMGLGNFPNGHSCWP